VFQLIVMAQLRDDEDPTPLMEFLRDEMPRRLPSIRRSEVRADLGLTKHLGHNATFTWIVDFDDQAGWQLYRDSEAHDEFATRLKAVAEQYLATQSITADAS
jgi:hypothetical protein